MTEPTDPIAELIDRTIQQAADSEATYFDLSMVGLYRLFLRAYGDDPVAAKNGFLQFMRGKLPAEVLAYCKRHNEPTST